MSTDRAPEVRTLQVHPCAAPAPAYRMPLQAAPLQGAVELNEESDPVVWVPDAYGQMVPMRRSAAPSPVQRTEQRDLTPAPLIDPRAQMLAAGGLLAAGTGWGIGQVFAAFAGISAGALMWLAIGMAAWKLAPGLARTTGSRTTAVEHHTHVTTHNRGLGRSRTTINH